MKKNLILGLFLMSVLLVNAVGVFAQEITGEVTQTQAGKRCGYLGGPSCDNMGIDVQNEADSSAKTRSSTSAKKSSTLRGWTEVEAADGTACYVKDKAKGKTGRFLGFMFKD